MSNAPAVEAVIIGSDGMPVRARVPDPRAFAVHKAWLSQQPDRDPIKKPRDLAQSQMMVEVLREHLPQYPFDAEQMRYFPRAVLQQEMPRSVDDIWLVAQAEASKQFPNDIRAQNVFKREVAERLGMTKQQIAEQTIKKPKARESGMER